MSSSAGTTTIPVPPPLSLTLSPLPPNPNNKSSRWSDPPLDSSDPPSAAEPPLKKVRNDAPPVVDSSDSAPAPASAPVASGFGDAGPNSAYPVPAPAPALAVPPVYAVSQHQQQQQPTTAGYQSYATTAQYTTAPPATYGSFVPGSAKGASALFYKTKLCTKFKIGACTFNERCHFAHGVEDLRKPSPGWESVVAASAVAMGTGQARAKTRPCKFFASGNCPYGDRCNFLHGNEEPQNAWGTGGAYPATAIQAPAVATDYGGIPAYSNGASVAMQYPNPNQAVANPSMINPPSFTTTYVTTDHAAAAVVPVTVSNMNPYASAPPMNPYPNPQDPSSGTSNYNYWNNTASNAPQMYVQANQTINQGNQTASWMPNYAADAYAKNTVLQYSHEQPQQQTVSTTPYVQQVGTYQQPDYGTRYNMAEAWGGKIQ